MLSFFFFFDCEAQLYLLRRGRRLTCIRWSILRGEFPP
uniref:Uncharacterized protein n=1 Tax=Rhizophora mucronata TaxID=61149 RepID=A0A2P2Q9V5_RHIMU